MGRSDVVLRPRAFLPAAYGFAVGLTLPLTGVRDWSLRWWLSLAAFNVIVGIARWEASRGGDAGA